MSEVEKCPKCGNLITSGKLSAVAAFTGRASVLWIDNDKGWHGRELLESYWNPKGLRAYRCKECGTIICYETTGKEKKE